MEQFNDENNSLTTDSEQSESSTSTKLQTSKYKKLKTILRLKNKYVNFTKFKRRPVYIDLTNIKLTRPPSPETIRAKTEKYTQFKLSRQFSSSCSQPPIQVKPYKRLWTNRRKRVPKQDEEILKRRESSTLLDDEKPIDNENLASQIFTNIEEINIDCKNIVPFIIDNISSDKDKITMKRKRKSRLSLNSNSPDLKTEESVRKKKKSLHSSLDDIPILLEDDKIIESNSDSLKSNFDKKPIGNEVQNVFQVMMDMRNNQIKSPKLLKLEKPKRKSQDICISLDSMENSCLKCDENITSQTPKKVEKENDKEHFEGNKSPPQQSKVLKYFAKINREEVNLNDGKIRNESEEKAELGAKISNDCSNPLIESEKKSRKKNMNKSEGGLSDIAQLEVSKIKFENGLSNKVDLKFARKSKKSIELKEGDSDFENSRGANLRSKRNKKSNESLLNGVKVKNDVEKLDKEKHVAKKVKDSKEDNEIVINESPDDSNDSNFVIIHKKRVTIESDSESSECMSISNVIKENLTSVVHKLDTDNCLDSETSKNNEEILIDAAKHPETDENQTKLEETDRQELCKLNDLQKLDKKPITSNKCSEFVSKRASVLKNPECNAKTYEKASKKKVHFSETVIEKTISSDEQVEVKNANIFEKMMDKKLVCNQNENNIKERPLNDKIEEKDTRKKVPQKINAKKTVSVVVDNLKSNDFNESSTIIVTEEIESEIEQTNNTAAAIKLLPTVQQKDLFTYFGLANANNVGIAIEKSGRTRREAKEKRDLLKLIKNDDVDVAQLTKDSEKMKSRKKKHKEEKKCSERNEMEKDVKEEQNEEFIEKNEKVSKLDNSLDEFVVNPVVSDTTPRKLHKKHKHRRKSNDENVKTEAAESTSVLTPRSKWKMKVRLALDGDSKSDTCSDNLDVVVIEGAEQVASVEHNSRKEKLIKSFSPAVSSSTNCEVSTRKKTSVKLAPIFLKNSPKSPKSKKVSTKEMEAKRTFLHSGIPATIRKKIEVENRQNEIEYDVFPSISHVHQKPSKSDNFAKFWNLKMVPLSLLPKLPAPNINEMLTEKLSSVSAEESPNNNLFSYEPFQTVQNYKIKLGEIKLAYPKYPVFKYFRLLSEQTCTNCIVKKNPPKEISQKNEVPETKKRKRGRPKKSPKVEALDDSIEIVEISSSQITDSQSNQNTTLVNAMWSEKYKPSKVEAMLGNKSSISELSDWLKFWMKNNEENKARKKSKRRRRKDNSDDSSDSDFDSNSCDINGSKSSSKGNTVILVGPNGSGKTSTVYSLCAEYGVNVLELNASSKRTGKKLLQDMQEATQSHQVRRKDALINFVQQSSSSVAKATEEKSADTKMCLLLVEDIDIVFENQDEGFISALATLLTNSKRPIVLVTSDPNCPHVEKFTNVHPVIKFRKPSPTHLAIWLQIICLLEGLNVDKDSLVELVEFNAGDIRKCLLQLEFWVRSGGDPIIDANDSLNMSLLQSSQSSERPNQWFKKPLFDVDECDDDDESSNMDWFSPEEAGKPDYKAVVSKIHFTCASNMVALGGKNSIPYPVNLGLYWWHVPKMFKTVVIKEDIDAKTIDAVKNEANVLRLNQVGNILECLGLIDNVYGALNIDSGLEPTPHFWQLPLRDSLEQNESREEYDSSFSIAHDWTHNILDGCFDGAECNGKVYVGTLTYSEKKSRTDYQNASINLANAIPVSHILSRKAVAADFLPALRTIHRTEERRCEYSGKRRNRFYHYLRSFNVTIDDSTSETIGNSFRNC